MVQVRTDTVLEEQLLGETLTGTLGPLPALQDHCHASLIRELVQNVHQILGLDAEQPPKAITLFTAHWQTHRPTISASEDSHLYYDYYGFPEEGYNITHNGKGSPQVAKRVSELLQEAGFEAQLNTSRGLSHNKTLKR
jgi:aromatic ring-opening dioxygenase catalytic subunit (LigB family)